MEALRPQVDRPDRELVLVESSGELSQQELARRWPWARVIAQAERTLPGRARNLAAREAFGELLAFTDADAVVEPEWLDELERALTDGVDGVAGVVLNGAPASAVGTADYLLEFSDWLPRPRLPVRHGATCNLMLRRAVLDGAGFPEELWPGEDTIVTFRIAAQGRLGFAPRARIRHAGRTRFRDFLQHQRRLGAAFATVCDTVEFPRRSLARRRYGPLLPVFRLVGVALRIRRHPAAIKEALRVSPLIAIGAVAWSTGLFRAPRGRSRRT
jgi:cellulose synthase/poly-beta-1,6-N-acetylglucosamine synthase-like glycosyltransferase